MNEDTKNKLKKFWTSTKSVAQTVSDNTVAGTKAVWPSIKSGTNKAAQWVAEKTDEETELTPEEQDIEDAEVRPQDD